MPGRNQIPSSTLIQFRSNVANRGDLLRRGHLPPANSQGASSSDPPAWVALARQLTADCATPWEQVEQIERWLREENEWDPARVPPAGCADVTDELLRQRGGPDYLFATAAAQMLNSIGIRTRLVTGFYADRHHFDPRSRQTIVWKENLHSWVEVCIEGDHWETVEPTPGFALPRRRMTWSQWSIWCCGQAMRWLVRHWLFCFFASAVIVGGWRFRLYLVDGLTAGVWRMASLVPHCDRCSLLLGLMAFRTKSAGHRRENGETWRDWVRRHFPSRLSEVAGALTLIDRQLYAGEFAGRPSLAGKRSIAELFAMTSPLKLARGCLTRIRGSENRSRERLRWETSVVEN
jgi:hypothetical protein